MCLTYPVAGVHPAQAQSCNRDISIHLIPKKSDWCDMPICFIIHFTSESLQTYLSHGGIKCMEALGSACRLLSGVMG